MPPEWLWVLGTLRDSDSKLFLARVFVVVVLFCFKMQTL